MDDGLLPTFMGAVQAAVSILLTIFYGAVAGQLRILDEHSTSQISKLCVQLFLPALLITNVGSELKPENAARYGMIVVWSVTYTTLTILLSTALRRFFKLPAWTVATSSFNSTTSMPLLLIRTLGATGILEGLLQSDTDTVSAAVKRAESYFLANALYRNVITFSLGPKILGATPPENSRRVLHEESSDTSDHGDGEAHAEEALGNESTYLLRRRVLQQTAIAGQRLHLAGKKGFWRLPRHVRVMLHFIYSLSNTVLVGGVLGAVLGLVPALHKAFFNSSRDGGIFNAWLISSLDNIGDLFAALQTVVVGARLSKCLRRMARGEESGRVSIPGALTTLVIRYILWPVVSTATIYVLHRRTNLFSGDPMFPFAMMLMPCGPPAMNLISLTDVAGSSESEKMSMAKLLTVSYSLSPLLAFAVVGAFRATQAAT